jgi:pimeloyl-ACP methyl ester carboxylesterase
MNPAGRSQPLTTAAWRDLRSTFVLGSQDRIPEILTPAFFDRDPEMLTLPTGHCPNWSRPDLVAELLLRSVEKMLQPTAT